jgi:hypothetical protein
MSVEWRTERFASIGIGCQCLTLQIPRSRARYAGSDTHKAPPKKQ